MQIALNAEIIEVINDFAAVQVIQDTINQHLKDSGLYFGHMVVDGKPVYGDYEEYIQEHLHQIQRIEIKLFTSKELHGEVLISAVQYLDRAVPETKKLVALFFTKPIEGTWSMLEQLLEGIQWLDQVIAGLNQSDYAVLQKQLHHMLPTIQGALQNQDNVLISDVLEFEIYPFMNELRQQIQNSIDNEVVRHDLN